MNNKNSRRRFLKYTAGLAGTVVATKAIGNTCEVKTGEQPLGPFFPRPGTPKSEVRENPDKNVPIYLANDNDLTYVNGKPGNAEGQQVIVQGVVTDKNCKPIEGANIIIWQASHTGMYNHQGDDVNLDFKHPTTGKTIKRQHDQFFQYWGKDVTDKKGKYAFKTIVPGFYPANLESGWYRPPHIHFMVSAMGHEQLVTQMYFRGPRIKENQFIQELNKKDPLLQNPDLSQKEKDELVVFFNTVDFEGKLLSGKFDIKLKT